jgi:serine/threonine protein kinase
MVVTAGAPRAVGVRAGFGDVPARVRAWVEDVLRSPVVSVAEQPGGMSPGCATRLETAAGARAFVKAVGPELNPDTPALFRHEAAVLGRLGTGPLWADLRAVLDEPRGWVALLLEDVSGHHPDLSREDDAEAVLRATDTLTTRLRGQDVVERAPRPGGPQRWLELWEHLHEVPDGLLPAWLRENAVPLERLHRELVDRSTADGLVHGDLRNDNMLLREDGTVVFVDWGMARPGPSWFDPLAVRLEWVEQPLFDELVASSPALRRLGDDLVTAFLVAQGGWLGYRTTVAVDVNLPTLNEFRRTESVRLLEGARRRLGL